MRSTYRVLAGLIALAVVAQASFIALGWFTVIKDLDDGAVIDKNYEGNIGHSLHGIVGTNVIPILVLLLLIVSFFAKVPGGVKWALITLGVVVLQIMLAFISFGAPAVGALHGINAIALFAVAGYTSRRAAPPKEPAAREPAAREPAATEPVAAPATDAKL